ncbi:MAG TPA: XRE family transcriptional regulator [Pseudonocardia sp.]|jgi:transcriptional regulator with XRE-family HTH domain|uniref:XRE family transcriptional regulator n=1 Tax=Pseudonocardia sp. TaxID=60912 RepID=UPI002B4AC2ED|nr:XRE family transcriptional regulator [Pseudonocardia sp.]HLU58389.1 XRE family transcriptional regulator [Pseudonocardia sp.]
MQSPEDVAQAVGRNVRALRQQRRMTIDALASAAGVSRGTVIQIETARGNPSIATLTALAAALRVGVASLVEDASEPHVTVRRAHEAATLWSSAAGSTAVFRIGTDPPDVVELWDWTLQPGDGFDGEAHPMGTQEVLGVLSGRLGLRVGASEHELDAGDTVIFEAHAPHRYSGIGDGPVRFVMVVLQPGDAGMVPPTSIAEAEFPLS